LKTKLNILLFSLLLPFFSYGQDTIPIVKTAEREIFVNDSIPADSLESIEAEPVSADSTKRNLSMMNVPVSTIDTTKRINYWRITGQTGEIFPVIPDTFLTDYFNRTNVEGQGVSVAYLGNLGLPSESRLFLEQKDRSEFMFLDPFWAYTRQPDNFHFTNTKVPYSNISYQTAGSRQSKEERFQALLTLNINKKLNLGFDVDYLYARGFYNNQGAKHLDWVFFGNYIDDRQQAHLFINPANYTNGENGGLVDDRWITNPEEMNARNTKSLDFPTRINNTWNHLQGTRYYFNYRYNLGFERKTERTDEDGNEIKQFVPVSSIIYTFDYTTRNRQFYTTDSASINSYYDHTDFLSPLRKNKMPRDSSSYNAISNTLGLSLREGFNDFAKFDLTAFVTQDIRNFTLMDKVLSDVPDTILFDSFKRNQSSTYIGGELAKKTGKILRYNAQGIFGIAGYNALDINLSGNIETRIPFLNDTASVSANGYIKRISPTFYENNYHSQYFWWENEFNKIEKYFIGGAIDIPHTKTRFSLGIENISNYIYFDETGYPQQHSEDIQILAAGLEQNFKLGALNWNNQVVYQTSSDQKIIALPDLSAYSSLFLQFAIAKVLTIQMGANAHYWTKYYASAYEPATQQFKIQHDMKIGEYPVISGFLNCHLKQTRFFLEYYNIGSMFINRSDYFSMPHYPINPTILKMGLSVDFHN
jgi:hypothetical protein